uniref:Uncharacterized protein n=1 Tax=Anguilla anguilla TaxID=7936 RepID=A0A0E9VHK5_ANGAN
MSFPGELAAYQNPQLRALFPK